jgi:3-keto-5-aminohexanoate cleavage enzyme
MSGLAIMLAPNGGRKSKADHPRLPITADETASETAACLPHGVQALHLHVRDDKGRHTLDPAAYLSAIETARKKIGQEPIIQITTESVGLYTPAQQRATIRAVRPQAASVAVTELAPSDGLDEAAGIYAWARQSGVAIQHILYSLAEFAYLLDLIGRGIVPGQRHSLIFVLGRYAADQQSDLAELEPLVDLMRAAGGERRFDWFVCAFGRTETAALVAAAALGGHCRIGFENSLVHADGTRAESNAERVAALNVSLSNLGRRRASREETWRALGGSD